MTIYTNPTMTTKMLILFFFSLSLFSATLSAADNDISDLTLVYTANLNGELEPCGCAVESDLGGIKRRAHMIQTLRKNNPDMVLLSSGGLLSSNSPRDKLKGLYILKGIATMNYDAIGVQWRDLSFGSGFIKQETLPWISSNWIGDDFNKTKTIKRNNLSLAVFNWQDPKKAPQRQMEGEHAVVNNDLDKFRTTLANSHDNNLNVVLTTLSLKKARKRLPLKHIDILVIRAVDEQFAEPKMQDTTLVLQPGTRGMRIAKIDINLDKNRRVKGYKQKVIRLPNTVPDAQYLTSWYDEYNARVKQAYEKRVATRKKLETGESPYAGEAACKTCHAAQHKVWQNSKHARAFEQLEAVNKAFDPDCIGCHTVGFEKPGGYIDATVTANLMHVQCESCHGEARAHVKSGGGKPVANKHWPKQKMCAQCHIGSHSPGFDLNRYWQQISHGQ